MRKMKRAQREVERRARGLRPRRSAKAVPMREMTRDQADIMMLTFETLIWFQGIQRGETHLKLGVLICYTGLI